MREPIAERVTIDGNMVGFRNVERIRDLLSVWSKEQTAEALAEITEALASKLNANDSRLSDARTPVSHGSGLHDGTVEATAHKGQANGYCELDGSGQVPSSRLPAGSAAVYVPLGAIVAWHKSLAGCPALPPEFAECNGQTISDAESPFHGQVLPNLNGENRFLRGGSGSGASGGTEYHNHGIDDPGHYHSIQAAPGAMGVSGGDFYPAEDTSLTGITVQDANTLPPYLEMVWVMRIK